MHGVMSVAVQIDNGAILLVTGRGGQALWLNMHGDGRDWVLTNLGEKHNELILRNKNLNGTRLQYSDAFIAFHGTGESTSYNALKRLGGNLGVVCYDWLASSGPKEGDPDENDLLFCMRFHVNGTRRWTERICLGLGGCGRRGQCRVCAGRFTEWRGV